jgi:uncharacterized membrane-anchored protein
MITKTKFWQLVRKELKETHRSEERSEEIMKNIFEKIKNIPQHEQDKQE